jgi:CheY-like chemotaxis protein
MPRPQFLVVDDDESARLVLCGCLEACDYDVSCARNGWEAHDLLRGGKPPALILLDLGMPVMDGKEFLERQRQDAAIAGIPVFLLSGSPDLAEIAAACKPAGYFRKPFLYVHLVEAVRRLMANGSQNGAGTSSD